MAKLHLEKDALKCDLKSFFVFKTNKNSARMVQSMEKFIDKNNLQASN